MWEKPRPRWRKSSWCSACKTRMSYFHPELLQRLRRDEGRLVQVSVQFKATDWVRALQNMRSSTGIVQNHQDDAGSCSSQFCVHNARSSWNQLQKAIVYVR
jgi:hypothetical protein